jgi:hypothetical protein
LNGENENIGYGKSLTDAVTWFFEQGIILEDDCVPSMSFFRFVRNYPLFIILRVLIHWAAQEAQRVQPLLC